MSEPENYRVAAVQMEPRLGEVSANLAEILDRFQEAVDDDARLVVFPECALTGYGFASRDEAFLFAEPFGGPASIKVAEVCASGNAWAIYGFLESDGNRLFNACVLIGPNGPVATYRKIHLPYLGVDMFVDPGDRPFAVYDAGGLRVGMHICYDGGFPEVGRILALLGADLLVLPTNWPTHSECAAEHMIATRAMENTVYAMAVNRVGEERGFRFIGRSSIVATNGQTLAYAGEDSREILYADLDPLKARRKHLIRVPGKHEINRIADRRPAFYEPLVAPNGRDQ